MEKTKIFSGVFFGISVLLAFILYRSIFSSINEAERIAAAEEKVIGSLKMIREAQIAYQAVNGQYTSDWDKLLNFVDSGSFYIVDRKEHIITLDYGADSVYIELDTVGTVAVRDSLFSLAKYPGFVLDNMPFVPGTDGAKFDMWADEIDKSGVMVDVLEVWNTSPFDPNRRESNEARTKKPLRFGSRTSITTGGNWE